MFIVKYCFTYKHIPPVDFKFSMPLVNSFALAAAEICAIYKTKLQKFAYSKKIKFSLSLNEDLRHNFRIIPT